MLKYPVRYYDERLLLRVSPLIWLSILYGIRHFFIVGAAVLMPMDVVTIPWVNLQASKYLMLADFPAVLVLLAVGHRVPNGWGLMRSVWLYGRWLLILSYVASIAVFFNTNAEVITDPNSWDFTEGVLVVIIDLAFVGYLTVSELARDIFNDSPGFNGYTP